MKIKIALSFILFFSLHIYAQKNSNSELPHIYIYTNNAEITDEPKIEAQMQIYRNANIVTPDIHCKIGIEIRGQSSRLYNKKKQYAIETRKENGKNLNISLLGMPAENDWILAAPYDDKTLIRDVFCYHLYSKIGWYAPRTRFCILHINDQYQGIYVLTEKIKKDKNRVSVFDDSSAFLLETSIIERIKKDENYFVSQFYKRVHIFKYPEKPTTTDSIYATTLFNNFERIIKSKTFATDSIAKLDSVINTNSLIDYIILNETIRNIDAFFVSTFWHLNQHNRIQIGPIWDCNISLGNANYHEGWKTDQLWVLTRYYPQTLYSNQHFKQQLHSRYKELRKNILSNEYILNTIDSLEQIIHNDISNNFKKWNILDKYICPNYFIGKTYSEEINYMKTWYINRLNWLDYFWGITPFYTETHSWHTDSVKIIIHNNNSTWRIEQTDKNGAILHAEDKLYTDSIFITTNNSDNTLFFYSIKTQSSIYSNTQKSTAFTLLESPIAPTNLSGTIQIDSTVELNWKDNAHNEDYYIVEHYTNEAELKTDTIEANQTKTSLNLIDNEFFTIHAINKKGKSNKSNLFQIKIPKSEYVIYPSVTNNRITLQASTFYKGDIKITILNSSGTVLSTSILKKNDVLLSSNINTSNLSIGTYYMIIEDTTKHIASFIKTE